MGTKLKSTTETSAKSTMDQTESTEGKQNALLLSAAKNGHFDTVISLLSSTLDVNFKDKGGCRAVDYAWDNKHFKIVLFLLKENSVFPNRFDMHELNDTDEGEDLKKFVEERDHLHNLVKEGDLDQIQKYCSIPKYFLNSNNDSLLSTALKCKQFAIYAFLRSIGVDFLNLNEIHEIGKLNNSEKISLEKALLDFPKSEPSHINFLMSKSRSNTEHENFVEKVKNYYVELDRVPEISIILKVVQYSDNLDIVFDFDEKEKITSGKNGKEAISKVHIYINPQAGERKRLGMIAHELTHLAMEMVFENDCNPYCKSEEDITKYLETVINQILQSLRKIHPVVEKLDKIYYNLPETLMDAIQHYDEKDHHSELIARVPQILVQNENGREWLEKNAFDLLQFYIERVIPKCRDFINQRQTIKPKDSIRQLNALLGEMVKLEKCNNIAFENVSFIKEISNTGPKQIFIFKTNTALLAMIKMLQRIFGRSYLAFSDRYVVANFESLELQRNEIMEALYSEECDVLIIRFQGKKYDEKLKIIHELLLYKPSLKIVFVMNYFTARNMAAILKAKSLTVTEMEDTSTSLLDLTEKSKEKILSREIKFQGTKMKLFDLIGCDKMLHELITGYVIEDILEGKIVHIENNLHEFTSFQDAYAHIDEEIKMDTFIHELKKSDDIFLINGMEADEEKKLCSYLQRFDRKSFKEINKKIGNISRENIEATNKSLILIEDKFSDEDFYEFCRKNFGKKIYFIKIKNIDDEPTFILQQIYNPKFYLNREFAKVAVSKKKIQNLIRDRSSDYFIVSDEQDADNLLIEDFENVWIVDKNSVPYYFSKLKDMKKPIHWFHIEKGKICWKESVNIVKGLSKYIDSEYIDSYHLKIGERRLAEELRNTKTVIISDTPGMGKSETLNELLKTKAITEEHWIIKVNLGNVKYIRGSYSFPLIQLVEDLQNMKRELKRKLTAKLIEKALNLEEKFPKRLLFAFDGFDEIRDEDVRKKVQIFLKYLKRKTDCKIWVTTTPQYQQELEDILSTFAIKFIPLNDKFIKLYIKKYFKDRLNLTFDMELNRRIFGTGDTMEKNSEIWHYATNFISQCENKVLAAPLQLNLQLKNSIGTFKEWAAKLFDGFDEICDEDVRKKIRPDISCFGFEGNLVFEKFFDKKYGTHSKKFNIDDNEESKIVSSSETFYQNSGKSMSLNSMSLMSYLYFKYNRAIVRSKALTEIEKKLSKDKYKSIFITDKNKEMVLSENFTPDQILGRQFEILNSDDYKSLTAKAIENEKTVPLLVKSGH